MIKAGVILLVVGVLVVAGAGFFTWTGIAPLMKGHALQINQPNRIPLGVKAGAEHWASVVADIGGLDHPQARDMASIVIRVLDEQGTLLADSAADKLEVEPNIQINEKTLLGQVKFTAPVSGKVVVEVDFELPEGKASKDIRAPEMMVTDAPPTTVVAKTIGGVGMTCCAGPLLAVVGLVLLIVGLVRRPKRPHQDPFNTPSPPSPYRQE